VYDLSGLLTPLDTDTFLRTCWGKNLQHVRGTPGKFSELLPWSALNSVLEQHRLEPPRLRLTREGKPVPATNYITYHANRKRAAQSTPRLNAAHLTRELRDGATLVLDSVDELHTPVTRLAESLERVFRVRIQVNAYAGWRTSHGFDLHWDDHDVFILQIAGRKDWKIYGMTRKYPLAKDVVSTVERPQTPIWEGRLEDGDLLYIPRGWWHVATPLDEPTLHLTVGVSNPTGVDLLAWFVDRLRASEHVRQDLPLFGTPEEQLDYLKRLSDSFAGEWSSNVMTQYLDALDAKARPRPKLSLPWTATPDALPPDSAPFTVRWNGARSVVLEREGEEIHVIANGRRWRFAAAAGPMLERLTAAEPCSIAELSTISDAARPFVRDLVINSLVTIVDL
jgi:hypothetical protein